jgi:glycosyltransferase involved in cell wall biosynthesis
MELTLGNVTHYLNLRREEKTAPPEVPLWVPIEYQASRMPWAIRGSLLARRALTPLLAEIDGIFVHTATLGLFTQHLLQDKPVVLSTDGTPLQKKFMREAYGLAPENALRRGAKRLFYTQYYRGAAGFVAWSNWCRDALIADHGLSPESVAVIPPGVSLSEYAPQSKRPGLPRILFVGGDFRRKGGELLLDVFRKRLRGRAELVIVTREPVALEEGVQVHHGVGANSEQLRRIYAESDVFALPTTADCYSIVCLEALAAGLPTVTTRVGGIPDIVLEGKTGFLIDPGDAGALGDALELLVADADRRAQMAVACREDARSRFDSRDTARRLFEFVRSRCGLR